MKDELSSIELSSCWLFLGCCFFFPCAILAHTVEHQIQYHGEYHGAAMPGLHRLVMVPTSICVTWTRWSCCHGCLEAAGKFVAFWVVCPFNCSFLLHVLEEHKILTMLWQCNWNASISRTTGLAGLNAFKFSLSALNTLPIPNSTGDARLWLSTHLIPREAGI